MNVMRDRDSILNRQDTELKDRHCEERSDEAIHRAAKEVWIASLRSQ
jgi:hypothetical protein